MFADFVICVQSRMTVRPLPIVHILPARRQIHKLTMLGMLL
jgi:hypothetical protein